MKRKADLEPFNIWYNRELKKTKRVVAILTKGKG